MSLFLFHFLAFFFFFSPTQSSVALFFQLSTLPSLSISLPLSSSSAVFRCVSACMHDRGKKKNPTRLGFWFGSQNSLAFFPFLSCCIYFAQTFAKMARSPCYWFGSIHAVYIFKALNSYAQKLFIFINNRSIVHQKKVFSHSCLSQSNFHLISTCNLFRGVSPTRQPQPCTIFKTPRTVHQKPSVGANLIPSVWRLSYPAVTHNKIAGLRLAGGSQRSKCQPVTGKPMKRLNLFWCMLQSCYLEGHCSTALLLGSYSS